MKLSFSTLGCPNWAFGEILSAAKDLAFDGVEIRGIGSELFAPAIKQFLPENLDATKARLAKLGLSVPMLTSGEALAEGVDIAAVTQRVREYIVLASKIGTPFVRVMGTSHPEITDGDFSLAASLYGELCEFALPLGVTPLIETNGKLSRCEDMLSFLDGVKSKNTGVLWDVHNTVRFGAEQPKKTAEALGSLIKHVHIKDSVVSDGKIVYKMMGHGDLPVAETVEELKALGYEGFISLEWLKRWIPDLQEPGIIFAHFKSYMDFNFFS